MPTVRGTRECQETLINNVKSKCGLCAPATQAGKYEKQENSSFNSLTKRLCPLVGFVYLFAKCTLQFVCRCFAYL